MLVLTILVICSIIGFIMWRKHNSKMKSIKELIRSDIADEFYVGLGLKIDQTLKHMFNNQMVEFPTGNLTINSIEKFSINGNRLEFINCKSVSNERYTILIDETENTYYFFNHIMTNNISFDTIHSPIVDKDVALSENGVDYEYTDESGLIEVSLTDSNISSNATRLVRLYRRDIVGGDEYVLLMQDGIRYLQYFVGIKIIKQQIEI